MGLARKPEGRLVAPDRSGPAAAMAALALAGDALPL
jgi:hypothetical protein